MLTSSGGRGVFAQIKGAVRPNSSIVIVIHIFHVLIIEHSVYPCHYHEKIVSFCHMYSVHIHLCVVLLEQEMTPNMLCTHKKNS